MKKTLVTILFSFLLTALYGQEAQLTGKIKDELQQPLELVYVSLLKPDSTPVKRALTDSLGMFIIQAQKGNYFLVLEEFGISREISLTQDTDLGEILLKESQELDGVTVTARKKIIEQRVDRLVFHVENVTSVSGGTALDALKATPTVRVQNDQVSIVGKGEVLVMVDDRLQRMSAEDLAAFLKSIPADNIQSIEVITTPPAKYDAEGNSGLINIKLKTARANSWNALIGTSYTQKTYAGAGVQGLFHYNRKKLSLEFSVNKARQDWLTTFENRMVFPDEVWDQQIQNRSRSNALSLGAGIDYKVSKRWTTGVNYLGSFTDRKETSSPLTTRLDRITENTQSYIASDMDASGKPVMNSVNWYHSFALDSTGKNLTIDLDHFSYRKLDENAFAGSSLDISQQEVPGTFFSSVNTNNNRIRNYSGKVDVTLPYKWADLSFGGKASYTHTSNDLQVIDRQTGIPVLNTDQSNEFTYREQNEALYVSAAKKLGKKWEGQMGMRMEATQTEGYSKNLDQTNRNQYVKLFPTAYLSYTANDSNSFSLTYSQRIRRPNFDYLNPFVIRSNPYDYSEGNPFLKPSYITNLEFSYMHNQKWVNAVYFSGVSDFGQEVSLIDPNTNIVRRTPMNYANTYQVGFSTYYHFNWFSWWNSYTGFNVNYQHIRSKTDFIASVAGYNGYCYSNNDLTLNKQKTIFAGVNYGWQLPGLYQFFRISTMHILDVSVKVLLLDKKLSLTAVWEDVLNGQRPDIRFASNGIQNTIRNYGDTRGVRLSVSYKFGNRNLEAKQRNSGNDEEKGRVE